MIKTLTLDGLTSVTIKQSAYDMARFCWVNNRSDSDIFMSCTDPHCTENADGVKHIPAGEHGMLDTESYETLYIKGSGMVNIETSPFAVCPFGEGKKGGGASLSGSASYTISNAVDYPLLALNLYGKSTQDGTPSPETPVDIISVGDSGSVEVVACGENILRPNVIANAYYNDNGDIIISSTFAMYDFVRIDGKKVTLSATKIQDGEGLRYALFDENKNFISRSLIMNAEKVVINSPNAVYIRVFISIVCYKDCCLAFGENGTTEHYKGNTASIETALPLCGVPVSEGGNYTDNNGQQWICDTLVYNADGTGKIIKHTAKIDSYNGEAITTPYMSTTGGLDTGATVIYQIDTPQEIALTAAEMTELMQMQTFDGVTNISNDSGADMDVKYCTDKALSEYVMPVITNMQAQIDELKSAVLSLGGNI